MIPKPAKGICSTVLLVLTIILAVASIPSATSQQFTTSTSILTSSLTQTTTYNLMSFTTSTWTGSGTSTTEAVFRSYLFTSMTASCYLFDPYPSFAFNSTGMTHVEYSVNGPMTLFIFSAGQNPFAVISILLSAYASSACNAANNAPYVTDYPHYSWDISAASYPATGSFDVNLPPKDNPYFYGMLCPLSDSSPTATLSISPLLGVYANTATSTIPTTLLKTSVTTLTFRSTLEVPFMQTYGSWMAVVIVGALVVAVLFFALRRTRTHRPRQASLSQFVKAPSSCIKCGAELPPASTFCNKCGAKQA